ncbi:MAG: hypothetical protein ABI609_18970 [Acidobacteriota bacterium]
MPRPLRYFEPGDLVEVTTRTLQGMLLLRPSPLLCEIILGVLGRAQALYGLRIHAFVFLSNHYHLLCSPVDSEQLARAMCFINSNLAREVGRLHGFREKFWSRRYQAIPVTGELAAQIERLRYLLAHGCKEGFVLTPGEWPGVHCIDALMHGKPLQGVWFDRTLEFEARRQGLEFGARDFSTVYSITLSPLPCWQHLSAEQYRGAIATLIAEIEAGARRRREETHREPAGAEFVRRQNPLSRPARSKHSPAPRIHAASRAARLAFREAYRVFLAAFQRASEKLRSGDRSAEFPRFSFPPSLSFARGPVPNLAT